MRAENNKKTKKEILIELEKATQFSIDVEKQSKAECYIDNGSYEEYRDVFRFMTRVFIFFIGLSLFLVLLSTATLANKEDSDIYITSRAGHVEEITNIKRK